MPVCGILTNNTRHVRFDWFSVRVIVSIIFTFFASIEVGMVVLSAAKEKFTLGVAGMYSLHIFYWTSSFPSKNVFLKSVLAISWEMSKVRDDNMFQFEILS